MKLRILFLLTYVFATIIYSQDDSTFIFYPKWVKGEKKELTVQYNQKTIINNDPYDMSMKIEGEIEINNVLSDTVFINWTTDNLEFISLPEELKTYIDSTLIEELNKISYKTKIDIKGVFLQLINLEEIVDKYKKLTLLIIRKQIVDSTEVMKKLESYKEIMKNKIIQECDNFVSPVLFAYGKEFPQMGNKTNIKSEIIGNDTIYVKGEVKLIESKNELCTFEISSNIDSTSMSKLLSLNNSGENQSFNIKNSDFMTNFLITLNKISGWITYVKRIESYGSESYKIETVAEYSLL